MNAINLSGFSMLKVATAYGNSLVNGLSVK